MEKIIKRTQEEFNDLVQEFEKTLAEWREAVAKGEEITSESCGLHAVRLADRIVRSEVCE